MSATWLSDSTELFSGTWLSSAYAGQGVPGDQVPSTGTNGPAAIYADLSLPADAAKEYRATLVTSTSTGTLVFNEDTSFIWTPPGSTGSDSFVIRVYEDGVQLTPDETIYLSVGSAALAANLASNSILSGSLSTAIAFAAQLASQSKLSGVLVSGSTLSASLVSSSTLNGALSTSIQLTAALQSTSTLSGTLATPTTALQAQLSTISTVVANLSTQIDLSAAMTSKSTLTGTLGAPIPTIIITLEKYTADFVSTRLTMRF